MKKSNKLELLKKAVYIREFEKFLLKLYSRGLLSGTVHTCIGQELTPLIVAEFLTPDDKIFSNHRGHGHYLASSKNKTGLLAEILGKTNGLSGGYGGSQHLHDSNFISNGVQGGLAPVAVGWAYAQKILGENNISVCYIGDGTLGEGQLYESLIISSLSSSPTLFILENNGYAQSTCIKQTHKGDIKSRIEGFGLKFFKTDIWNIDHFAKTASDAVQCARMGEPALLEVECYRLYSHSKGDDNRKEEEINRFWERDLLTVFEKNNSEEYINAKESAVADIEQIFNEIADWPALSSYYEYEGVYEQPGIMRGIKANNSSADNINKLIYDGLDCLLSKDDAILIGEDIQGMSGFTEKEYGGAFKVTRDLSEKYPTKVLNSSISEAGIVGFSIGVSLAGCRGICEIMFGDFMTLAFDQVLQQASKIPTMFGKRIKLPLLIRTPMGGRRGYGPTHSQCLEKHFLFLPNITVIALNSLLNPKNIIEKIGDEVSNPVLLLEDKVDYTRQVQKLIPLGYELEISDENFPTCVIRPVNQESDLLIHAYGGQVSEVLEATSLLIYEDIFPTIIVPIQISPYNIYQLKQELSKCKKLLFVEEGSKLCALSSEVVANLVENQIDFQLIGRVSNDSVIPCYKNAELEIIPNSISIFQHISKLLRV